MTNRAEMRVDPSNEDQFAAWDGDTGEFWANRADRFNEGVARYHDQLVDAAAISAGATVLDIGCGAGQTTRDAARIAADGSALGVDLSARMIALARELATGEELPNATFEQADAQVHPFHEQHFDVAISRHGTMFFGDPTAAFANIARALRPNGRLVLLTWQQLDRNSWMAGFRSLLSSGQAPAAPTKQSPTSLSDPDDTRDLLRGAGFVDVELHGLHEPMYFGKDVDDACEFISGQLAALLRDLDASTKAKALNDLRADMAEHLSDAGVRYDSAAWLIEASRG